MKRIKKIFLISFILMITFSYQSKGCTYKVELYDYYWNGWMGSKLSIVVGVDTVLKDATMYYGYGPTTFNFDVNTNDSIRVVYTAGSDPISNFFKIYNGQENLIYVGGSTNASFQPKSEKIGASSFCPSHDLKLVAVTSPKYGCGLNSSVPISISLRNYGSASESNFNVSYTVNGGLTWTTEQVYSTISSGGTLNYTFTQQANMAAYKQYKIQAAVNLNTDEYSLNDSSMVLEINHSATIVTFPYNEDFEDGVTGWYSGGTNSSWKLGLPQKADYINSVPSGDSAWVTNLISNYNNKEHSYVESPCFNFSTLINPVIEFKYNRAIDWSDGVALMYSTDGSTWQTVNSSSGSQQWLNNWNQIFTNAGYSSSSCWGGNSWGWVTALNNISFLAGQSSVKFRFVFLSDSVNNNEGFAFDDFKIYQPDNMRYDSLYAYHIDTNMVRAKDKEVVMLKMELKTVSSTNPIKATKFIFKTTGTTTINDIRHAQLFTTGMDNYFDYWNRQTVGTSVNPSSNTFSFSDSIVLAEGINYFWLTYDIDSSAAYKNYVDAVCDSIVIADTARIPTKTNYQGSKQIMVPLAGTYTIAQTGTPNFNNFTEAVSALTQRGISAPVVFEVGSGTYTEQIVLPQIAGSSDINTIIFRSASGDSTDVNFTYSAIDYSTNYVVKLNGIDNCTFSNMTFQATGTNYGIVFNYSQTCNNITINNCKLTGISTTSSSYYYALVYSDYGYNTKSEFKNNSFINGSYGIYYYDGTNILVDNNSFTDEYYGIYFNYCNKSVINRNTIITQRTGNFYGIYLNNCNDSIQVTNNKINSTNTSNGYGMYVYYGNNYQPDAKRILIANNMISVNAITGMYINYSNNIDIVYNSILTNGNNTNSYAFYIYSCQNGILVKNNNIVNKASGYALLYDNGFVNSNYNNLFTNGVNFARNSSMGLTYTSLGDYKVASKLDSLSISIDPNFVANDNLHTHSYDLNNAGTPLSLVKTDIDGEIRDTLKPDIGADEYDVNSTEAALLAVKSPISGCSLGNETVKLKIKNRGSSVINGNLIAYYQFNGGSVVSQNVTGSINAGDTSIFSFTTKANMAVTGKDSVFNLTTWIVLIDDTVHTNDTIKTDILSGYMPFEPLVTSDTVNFGEQALLKAIPVDENYNVFWYDSLLSNTVISDDTAFTTPRLSQTKTYYVQTVGTSSFTVNSLLATNSSIVDHYDYSGYSYQGGIAVTKDYIYVVGYYNTARYKASDLSSPVSLTRRDGIFSDLKTGKLYTLWNGSSDPTGSSSYTATAIRSLNEDLTLGSEIINLSSSITISNGSYRAGIYAGSKFVILEDGSTKNIYKVDLKNGAVTSLGIKTHAMKYYYRSWATWGVAEFDGVNYSILYRPSTGQAINCFNITKGTETTLSTFSDLGYMENFTISPWTNKWYLHFEYDNQFGNTSQSLVSADAAMQLNNVSCGSTRIPVKATVLNTPPKISFSNDTLLLNNVMQWTSIIDTLYIHNAGGDTLKIFGESSGNSLFTITSKAFNLIFSEEIGKIPVTFSPIAKGVFSTTLTISNNDKDTTITLIGKAFGAPTYSTNRDSIVVYSTMCHDTIHIPLEIHNTGDTSLTYEIYTKKISGSSSGKVLLIGQDSRFESILLANNYSVTKVNYVYNYTGNNPSLNDYNAVIIADGINYGNEMPSAGQTALVDYVNNGGGLLSTDRSTYEIYYGNFSQMLDLFPLRSTYSSSSSQTLTKLIEHPITKGLSNSFSLPYCGYSNTTLNSGTTLISGSASASAVAINEIGLGRVVEYGFTSRYNSYDPFADTTLQTLFLNTIKWISAENWLTINNTNDTVLKQDTNIVDVAISNEDIITGNFSSNIFIITNDPKHTIDTIPIKLFFTGSPDLQVLEPTLTYSPIFQFEQSSKTIHLVNRGCDTLKIDSIRFSSTQFTKLSSSSIVLPGDTGTVVMQFNPTIKGAITDLLYVYTNDVDTLIQLSALALGPPTIHIVEDSILSNISFCNDSIIKPLKIYNNGDTSLIYTLNGVLNQAKEIKVLILGADDATNTNDVKVKLDATNKFKSVTVIDSRYTTPTVSQLQQYDAVLVWSDYGYSNNTELGNNLADYVDGGGGVVSAVFETAYSNCLQGRWSTGNYYIINRNSYKEGAASLGIKNQPYHYIVKDVNSFNGGYSSFRPSTTGLTSGSSLIASWSDGMPLVAEKNINGTRRIDLGFFPTSSTVNSDYWNTSTDGAKLLANSLLYVAKADITWLISDIETDTLLKGDTATISLKFKSTNLISGSYEHYIVINSNDPISPIDTVYTKMVFQGHPIATATKDSIDYNTLFQYSTCKDSLYIRNTGCDTLFIDSLKINHTDYQTSLSKTVVIPNDSVKVVVTFNPQTSGSYAHVLNVYTNDVDEIIHLNALVLSPPKLWYASDTLKAVITVCNDTLIKELKIINKGDTTLFVHLDILGGTTLISLNKFNDTLLAGDTAIFKIKFNAEDKNTGIHRYPIYITSNDPLRLKDTIITEMKMEGYPIISDSPSNHTFYSQIDFGSVMQYAETFLNVPIYNNGCDTLFITNLISTNPDFYGPGSTLAIAGGYSGQTQIMFKPSKIGAYQDTITFINNDSIVKVVVKGIGTPPPIIKTDVDSLNFSISSCNDSITYPIKVWNEGIPNLTFNTAFINSIIKPALCKPITIGTCCGMGIYQVQLNTINNISGNAFEGYMDFSSTQSTVVEAGKTYSIYVKTGNAYNEHVRAWIDYNNDGVFDNSEKILESLNTSINHLGNITIPVTANRNQVLRMRVGSEYYSYSAPQPCMDVTYGQFEDYSIIVSDGISITNTIDTVAQNDTSIVMLHLKPATMVTGLHTDTIVISSNDPLHPTLKISYNITVESAPTKPKASNTIICFNQLTPALHATGTNLKWYSDNEGKDTLITSADSLLLNVTAIGTYKIHVTQTDIYGCESNDTMVSLKINAIPSQPTVSNNSSCAGDSINNILTAVSSNKIKWYSDASLTTIIDTNAILHTGKKTQGVYTYYVIQKVLGCAGPSDTVSLTVHANPAKPIALDTLVCFGTSIPLLTAKADSLHWYSNTTLTNLLYKGDKYNTGKTAPGIYNYYVTQIDTATKCKSIADTSTLTIRFTPAPAANSEVVCFGQPVPVLVAQGYNIHWYNDALLTNLNTINDSLNTGQTAVNVYTYYAVQTDSLLACQSPARTVTLSIQALPAKPVASDKQVCFGAVIPNLTSTGNGVKWYSDASLLTEIHSGSSYATGKTTVGKYDYYITQTANGCTSTIDTATLIIDSIPSVPTANDVLVCSGNPLTDLTATGTFIKWYTDVALTNLVYAGNTYSTGKTFTGVYTYYATQTYASTNCASSAKTVVLTIDTVPSLPVATNKTACEGGVIPNLIASGTNVKWYSDSILTNLVYTGDTLITGQTNPNIYTYYAVQSTTCGNSKARAVTLTINANPQAPISSDTAVCYGSSIPSLKAVGSNIKWYSNSNLSTLVFSGNTFNTGKSNAGSYIYYLTQTIGSCTSSADSVTLIIQALPMSPTGIDKTICLGDTVPKLIATGTRIKWYNDIALTTKIDTGTTLNTGKTLVGIYSFYATQTNQITGCQSNPKVVRLTINDIPLVPTALDAHACTSTGTISLTATGTNIQWYTDSILSDLITSGLTYTASVLDTGTFIYYVTQTVSGCKSKFNDVILTVKESPVAPVALDKSVCEGLSVPALIASGTSIKWYNKPLTAFVLVGFSDTLNTGKTNAGIYTYYATQTSVNGCESVKDTVMLTIHPKPATPLTTDATMCYSSSVPAFNIAGSSIKWYADLNLDTLVHTGNTYTPSISSVGKYNYFVTQTDSIYGCISNASLVNLTMFSMPIIDSVQAINETVCNKGDGQIHLFASSDTTINYSINGGLLFVQQDTFNSLAHGNYPIVVSNAFGCKVYGDTISISSTNAPAAPTVTDAEMCLNDSIPPLVVIGNTIKWYSDPLLKNLLIVNDTLIPVSVNKGVNNYYATSTDGSSCESKPARVKLTVWDVDAPVVSNKVARINMTIPNLTAVGSSIKWYTDTTLTTLLYTGNSFATGKTSIGKYTYYVTNTDISHGCVSAAIKVSLTIYDSLPVPTTKSFTICQGAIVPALTASGYLPKWYSDASLLTLVHTGNIFNTGNITSGIYTYYVTQTDTILNSETASGKATLTIHVIPAKPAIADVIKCSGDSVVLSNASLNTHWYDENAIILDSGATYKPNTVSIGTYIFLVSDVANNCESPKDTVLVKLKGGPSIDSVSNTLATACKSADASISIHATSLYTLNYSIDGGNTYQTSNIFNALAVGNYPIAIKEVGLCTTLGDTIIILSNTTPAMPTVTDTSICVASGNPALTAVGTNLKWYSDIALTDSIASGTTYTPTVTGAGMHNYFVKQEVSGCASPAAKATLTIHALPAIPITTDVTNCASNSAILNASGTKTIKWYNDSTLITLVQTGSSYPVGKIAVGVYKYYLIQTDGITGCSSSFKKVILNNYQPSIPVASDKSVCFGSVVPNLTAAGNSVKWYADATLNYLLASGNTCDTKRTKVGKDTYYVTQTDSINCISPAKTVSLTVNPNPLVTLNSDNEQLLKGASFTIKAYNAQSYKWLPYTTLSESVGASVIAKPDATTTYIVTGSSDFGCTNTAAITITVITGVDEIVDENDVVIYPNPTNDYFNITMKMQHASDMRFNLYNEDGQLMESRFIKANSLINEHFSVKNLAQGIYNLQIISTDKSWQLNKRIIIQK